MNEVVKYNNYLNDLKLKNFTSTDLNFLMTICSKMKDKDVTQVEFEFAEIKELANYKITSNARFITELERMNKKLMEVTCRLEFDNRILMFILFPTFEIDLTKNLLIVSVNERFKFILNELIKDFTRFELQEFVSLESKYSKNLYRFLKQFRTTGFLKIADIEDFRNKMDCPRTYANKEFMRTALVPAVQELQEKEIFKNLVCTPQKARKRGSPVIGYTFTFDPEVVPQKSQEEDLELEKTTSTSASQSSKSNYKKSTYKKWSDQFPQTYYDFDALEREILSN